MQVAGFHDNRRDNPQAGWGMIRRMNRPTWPFPQYGKLTAHANGQWCKKIEGKLVYFGQWANPDKANAAAMAALRKYMGRLQAEPVVAPMALTVGRAMRHYLTAREKDLSQGTLCASQFVRYRRVAMLVGRTFGDERLVGELEPADFEKLRRAIDASGKLGPASVGGHIQWIRTIFGWVDRHYGVRPRMGDFRKPSRLVMRKARVTKELFTPLELRKVVKHAGPAVRCFVLLGINCGFGAKDCADLPRSAVDLKRGVIRWQREKTGIMRACPLWPETVKALKAYRRPHTAELPLFFITARGHRWVREHLAEDEVGLAKVGRIDPMRLELVKVFRKAGVKPRGFYTLRHTFRTVADAAGDGDAVRVIMGQAFAGVDEFYLHLDQRPDLLKRLRVVTARVRRWMG